MWTWSQLVHELGILTAWLIAIACLAYLSRNGFQVFKQQRKFSLRDILVLLTLAAALLGAFIGLNREEKDGLFGPYPGKFGERTFQSR
jgi:hypothetical protein